MTLQLLKIQLLLKLLLLKLLLLLIPLQLLLLIPLLLLLLLIALLTSTKIAEKESIRPLPVTGEDFFCASFPPIPHIHVIFRRDIIIIFEYISVVSIPMN